MKQATRTANTHTLCAYCAHHNLQVFQKIYRNFILWRQHRKRTLCSCSVLLGSLPFSLSPVLFSNKMPSCYFTLWFVLMTALYTSYTLGILLSGWTHLTSNMEVTGLPGHHVTCPPKKKAFAIYNTTDIHTLNLLQTFSVSEFLHDYSEIRCWSRSIGYHPTEQKRITRGERVWNGMALRTGW